MHPSKVGTELNPQRSKVGRVSSTWPSIGCLAWDEAPTLQATWTPRETEEGLRLQCPKDSLAIYFRVG